MVAPAYYARCRPVSCGRTVGALGELRSCNASQVTFWLLVRPGAGCVTLLLIHPERPERAERGRPSGVDDWPGGRRP